MTFFVLASVSPTPPVVPPTPYDSRIITLESWDGTSVLPIMGSQDHRTWRLLTGARGLQVAPTDVSTAGLPTAAGSVVDGVFTLERPVLLPLEIQTQDQAEQFAKFQELRDLTDPTVAMTPDGNFRLVVQSSSGTRQIGLAYLSGLEGEELYTDRYDRVVLSCVAPQPFAEDRTEQSAIFRAAAALHPFLAPAGTDYPWPRMLTATTALAAETPVVMTSAVPVWPKLEVAGAFSSLLIESEAGLRVDVPDAQGSDETLTIVSDPRRKSIRVNGEAAAGRLARGSRLVPFALGKTVLSVDIAGATTSTELRISWRGLHRSLW